MKSTMPFPVFFAALALCALFPSCSRYEGYGVMNWSVPELDLYAGDVVPVCIRSNISNLYVIELPSSGHGRQEIPLWQLSLYPSRARAERAAEEGQEFRHLYASVKTDGLPVREEPDNTARQVYRLRRNEVLKITGTGEGVDVYAGNSPLEGQWYTVMTEDGTQGWCFSYNLTVFDEREGAPVSGGETSGPEEDATLQYILSRTWYPSYYRAMLESHTVDISRINPAWGFFPGPDSRIARIEEEEGAVSFPYTGISADGAGTYRFDGSSLSVELRRGGTLAVQFTDEFGMPAARYFAALDTTPERMIRDETGRRAQQLARIRDAGPRFVSGNYGVLQFTGANGFLWSGYSLLVPSVIPRGAGAGGTAEIRCFLSGQLSGTYDGVLSLQFEGRGGWIHFLYSFSPDGLRLEPVSPANVSDNIVLSRDISPTVIFFYAESGTGEAGG